MLRRYALFIALTLFGGTAAAEGMRLSLQGIEDEALRANVSAYLTPIEKEGTSDTFSDRARIDKILVTREEKSGDATAAASDAKKESDK